MKKLALIITAIILTLNVFSQSPHWVKKDYRIESGDTTEIVEAFTFVSIKIKNRSKKDMIITLENENTGHTQKVKYDIIKVTLKDDGFITEGKEYLTHVADYYLWNEEFGYALLEKDDNTYIYKLHTDRDESGNYTRLIIM